MQTAAPSLWSDALDSPAYAYVGRWMRHFPALRATALEAWYPELADQCLPALTAPLSPDERDLLVDEAWRRRTERASREPEEFDGVVEHLEELVLQAQERSPVGAAFVRLSNRAPLDSAPFVRGDRQVDGGPEALEALLTSERVFDHLCLAQECAHAPALVVRPWLEIPAWTELRAFVRQGCLVGLSQRHTDRPFPQLHAGASSFERAVREALGELRQRLPRALPGRDELVLDFVLQNGRALLLDVQPWLPWTDPALFDWRRDRFEDYELRLVPL